jgi:DNA polymerase-3 subunit alpha
LRTTKKGDKFALLRLEDEAGGTKCVLWPEIYKRFGPTLHNELAVLITGRLELSEDNPPTIIAEQVQSLDVLTRNNEILVLRTPQNDDVSTLFDAILSLLSAHPGESDVAVEAQVNGGTIVRIKANPALRVKPGRELEEALKSLGCVVSMEKNGQTRA